MGLSREKYGARQTDTAEQIAALNAKGMTCADIGRAIGVSQGVVGNIRRGCTPSRGNVHAIAKLYERTMRPATIAGPALQGKLGSLSPRG
ncbi:hypothetical protein [Ensifer canadensis]